MTIKIMKVVWVGFTLLILLVTLYAFDDKPNSDIDIFLSWSMLVLSFPAGLIFALLFTGISILLGKYFSMVIYTTYLYLGLSWLILFVLGYLQWFKLMPYLVGRLCELKRRDGRPKS